MTVEKIEDLNEVGVDVDTGTVRPVPQTFCRTEPHADRGSSFMDLSSCMHILIMRNSSLRTN